MKNIVLCLLCLAMYASLACCATNLPAERSITLTEHETIPLSWVSGVVIKDDVIERTKALWKSVVIDREQAVTSIVVTEAFGVPELSPPIYEQKTIDRFLEICGSLQLDDLAHAEFSDSIQAAVEISAEESSTGESLTIIAFESCLLLKLSVGENTYYTTASYNEEFAQEFNAFFKDNVFIRS